MEDMIGPKALVPAAYMYARSGLLLQETYARKRQGKPQYHRELSDRAS